MEQLRNPYSPIAYSGLNYDAPQGCIDRAFTYIFDIVLTALQNLPNQTVAINTDAEFILRGIVISFATGTFSFRWSDSQAYYFSNALMSSSNMSFFFGNPFPVIPEVWYPPGGKIGIDIADTSNAGNTIEISFIGVKRFRLAQ